MKNKIIIFVIIIFGSFFCRETIGAITLQGNSLKQLSGYQIQPANVTYYSPMVIDSTLTVNKPGYFPSGVHVGQTGGEGGVTYFNGTILNASAGNKPVTISDDLRVDGKIIRYNKEKLAPVQIKSGLFLQGDIYGYKDLITFDDNVKIKTGKKLTITGVTIEGLSVSTSQIANDAMTSAKIKDGTIVGSDISSSAELNVKKIELSDNATQTYSKNGIIKAVAYISSTGGVTRSWNPASQESISVTHTEGSTTYQLNFHWDVSGRYFQVTPVSTNSAITATANFNANSQIIDVYTSAENAFIITIY
ncbi:MAG: hypothetical protein AB1465_06475 [Patescibacteria group bacterium]